MKCDLSPFEIFYHFAHVFQKLHMHRDGCSQIKFPFAFAYTNNNPILQNEGSYEYVPFFWILCFEVKIIRNKLFITLIMTNTIQIGLHYISNLLEPKNNKKSRKKSRKVFDRKKQIFQCSFSYSYFCRTFCKCNENVEIGGNTYTSLQTIVSIKCGEPCAVGSPVL